MLYTFETLTWNYTNDDVSFEVKSREIGLTLLQALDKLRAWANEHLGCAPDDVDDGHTIIELDDDIRDNQQDAARIQCMEADDDGT